MALSSIQGSTSQTWRLVRSISPLGRTTRTVYTASSSVARERMTWPRTVRLVACLFEVVLARGGLRRLKRRSSLCVFRQSHHAVHDAHRYIGGVQEAETE
jgi:YD repeat-containing protein